MFSLQSQLNHWLILLYHLLVQCPLVHTPKYTHKIRKNHCRRSYLTRHIHILSLTQKYYSLSLLIFRNITQRTKEIRKQMIIVKVKALNVHRCFLVYHKKAIISRSISISSSIKFSKSL